MSASQSINTLFLDTNIHTIYDLMINKRYLQANIHIANVVYELSDSNVMTHFCTTLISIQKDIILGSVHKAHERLRMLHYDMISPFLVESDQDINALGT
jgi:hypothetical protein